MKSVLIIKRVFRVDRDGRTEIKRVFVSGRVMSDK